MILTNTHNLPAAVVSAISRDPYDPGDASFTATSIIKPPRVLCLEQRHDAQIIQDATDRIWALLGQTAHKILERADATNAFHEERISARVSNRTISCQTDVYRTHEPNKNAPTGFIECKPTISDYKFIKVMAWDFPHPDWEQQLNINAFIWRDHDFPVERLEIVAIFRDWSKMMSLRIKDYPLPIAIRVIPLWAQKTTEEFIKQRIKDHSIAQQLEDKYLPFCTPEDQWRRKETFAVMKKNNKRALKLCSSLPQAEDYIRAHKDMKVLYVEYREPQPVRCLHFCTVRPFCNQFVMENPGYSNESNTGEEEA